MKLEQSFEVKAPIDEVWAALTDVQRVAPCLPGAEITEAADDGVYRGNFTVKIGPTTASYRGTLRMVSQDDEGHVATMQADGQDKRGQGGAKATIVSRLTEQEGATRVDVDTDFTITGRLARFGRGGMIQDVSNKLLGQFAQCLQTQLAGGNGAATAPQESAELESGDEEAVPSTGSTNGASGQAPPTAPLDAGSVILDVARNRAKEKAPLLVGAALLLALLLVLLRRRAK
ncbi:MAG: carbon monoxide dehydrogenase [Solirubrobacterales bacterium]|jgi:carbon monoxide dehydrogenase subunit G|nr:carbon monoxide dehydrogenase [Solirubrobacterales bacterium]